MTPRHEDRTTLTEAQVAPVTVLESDERLSRSILWKLQRRYFDEAGVSAWSTTTVPHYVTCNPAMAHAYAATVLGWLRDLRDGAQVDPGEPVNLVELGAGSGRFAYLFLRELTERLRRAPLAGVRVRYVMTDFTETNVRFFEGHRLLRPFVEQGVLDFALFDAEEDRELHLRRAGVTLGPGSLKNPLGVVANYVFDGLRQDAFSFVEGALQERLVSISAPGPVADGTEPALLERLDVGFTSRPAPLDYYREAELDAILRGYAARFDGGTILFPVAAIRCLARLADLSGGRMLLLSGDRGDIREEALVKPDGLGLARHGGFSLDVNYHAIAAFVRARGGEVLEAAHRHAHLQVLAFTLGAHPSGYAETRLAYEEAIGRSGPDDLFALRRGIEGSYEALDLGQALSLIRLYRWDPRVLRDCLPVLWKRQPEATAPLCEELVRTVMRVWESFYPIGEREDLAFELGLLVHAYGAPGEALSLFQESIRLHGDDARARWNMGLCHYARGELEAAVGCFLEAARVEPGFVPVGAVQVKG